MLGADGIFVDLAGEAHELRPSLRASMRLVRRHGLTGLLAAVQDFNVTVILDVLREAAINPSLLLAEIAAVGLGKVRTQLTDPLAQFVLAIAGINPDDATQPEPTTAAPVEPEEVFARLYRIATGWLGWTPEQAWLATPAEIIAARDGRTDLITDVLKAIFGTADASNPSADEYTPERLEQINAQGFDPAFDREGLHALKSDQRA